MLVALVEGFLAALRVDALYLVVLLLAPAICGRSLHGGNNVVVVEVAIAEDEGVDVAPPCGCIPVGAVVVAY